MKPLTAKKLIKILVANGFILSRQKGSHQIYINYREGLMVTVPLHGKNKKIPIGTFMEIVKQSKIPKKEFNN